MKGQGRNKNKKPKQIMKVYIYVHEQKDPVHATGHWQCKIFRCILCLQVYDGHAETPT